MFMVGKCIEGNFPLPSLEQEIKCPGSFFLTVLSSYKYNQLRHHRILQKNFAKVAFIFRAPLLYRAQIELPGLSLATPGLVLILQELMCTGMPGHNKNN